MSILTGLLDRLFSYALLAIAVWFLIIITPLINGLRKESADPDIVESWQDVEVAIRFIYAGTKNRIINKLRRTK